MSRDLDAVKERARDIFLFRAPAIVRWGEGLLRAVDAVTVYAYREGRQYEHERHQDERYQDPRNKFVVAFSDNRGLLSNLVTLALSASAVPVAATAVGPLVPPLLAWGLALLVVLVLLGKTIWGGR